VRWKAEQFEMRFPPGTFDRPLRFADPAFRAQLVEAAQRELSMRKGRRARDRVRSVILTVGFSRRASVSRVAHLLGTTPRTLQRWLSDEGLTFSGVRDATLRDEALELLGMNDASIADVAARHARTWPGGTGWTRARR
jgi:AraC-like DNA-binding protein